MGFELAIERPDGSLENRRLEGAGPFLIGREPACDVVLSSEEVSRRHAVFERRDGETVVTDTSANGTLVSEERLRREAAPLPKGGAIRIGRFQLHVQWVAPSGGEEPLEDRVAALLDQVKYSGLTHQEAVQHLGDSDEVRAHASLELAAGGPLDAAFADPSIDRGWILGPRSLWVDRGGAVERLQPGFSSAEALRRCLSRVLPFDLEGALAEVRRGRLEREGGVLEIRAVLADDAPWVAWERADQTQKSLQRLSQIGWIGDEHLAGLLSLASEGRNLLVIGPPNCGKRTLLAAMAGSDADSESMGFDLPGPFRALEGLERESRERWLRSTFALWPRRVYLGDATAAPSALSAALEEGRQGIRCAVRAASPRGALERLARLAAAEGGTREDHRFALAEGLGAVVVLAADPRGPRVSALLAVDVGPACEPVFSSLELVP